MANLLFYKHGQILKYDGTQFTQFSQSTSFTNSALYTENWYSCGNIVRTNDNKLLFVAGQATGPKIYMYDPTTDSIYEYHNFGNGNTFYSSYTTLYVQGDEIALFAGTGTGYITYVSYDNGNTWTGSYASAGTTNKGIVSDIIKFKGKYYVFTRDGNLYTVDPASNTWTLLAGYNVKPGGFAVFRDNLYFAATHTTGQYIVFGKIVANSIFTLYTYNTNYTSACTGVLADPVNDKVYFWGANTTGGRYGFKSTDNTVSSFVQDNNIISSVTANKETSFRTYFNSAVSSKIRMIQTYNGGLNLFEWNSTTETFDIVTQNSGYFSNTMVEYTPTNAYGSLTPRSLNSSGNRYQLYVHTHRYGSSATATIDPKFSSDSGFSFSNMTIDESKSGYAVVLPDVTIGSYTNNFNDNFGTDQIQHSDGYWTMESGATTSYSIANNLLAITIGNGENLRLQRRFLIYGNFSVGIGFNGLGTSLTPSGYLKFGLRAYPVGDSGKWYTDQNYVEVFVEKTTTVAGQYGSKHVSGGTVYTATPVTAPSAGEDPALYIDRTSSLLFSTSYGSTKTALNPGVQTSANNNVLIEIFVENTSTNDYVIELKNLTLFSGILYFIGGVTSLINWQFQTDGILQDTDVIAKVVTGD